MSDFFRRVADEVSLLGNHRLGWRRPQIGALGAILAHWSLADRKPTVISIPTGTGKTAVAMVAPFLATNIPSRVLVVAPAKQVRQQLVEQFSTYNQLKRLGVVPESAGAPEVHEMVGITDDWSTLEQFDVVVALPNSISPVHYDETLQPPKELFDLIVVDEAHHSPATTWRAILDHFSAGPALLLTATPRRRDGRPIPGSLEYYYPLRRALEEGLYKPIQPVLLPSSDPPDRRSSDASIAASASTMLSSHEHSTSVLLVRGGTITRLKELKGAYSAVGVDLELLHNGLSDTNRKRIIGGLRSGAMRAVGVVGMLGEGFDLPAIRLVAYHDKHKSLLATVQLVGRLARVDPDFPQASSLITVADTDVFPELKGIVRQLYDEDADWAEVLPGIIDDEIRREHLDREFVDRFQPSQSEVDPTHLQPTKRAIVYEVPPDWEPTFLAGAGPQELQEGSAFMGGSILYLGTDTESGLLVVVVRYVDRPKWSSDPALANVVYELHVVAYRKAPRVTLPGLVLLNLEREGLQRTLESILGLDQVGRLAGPDRVGAYLDSLDRVSVSSVGVRSTNASTRGRATYRNFMGSGVDRGLRNVDMARSALGHVMFQVNTSEGASNAGGAVEKSKVWLTRYGQLRELSEWVDATTALLWFPQLTAQGPILPGVDRGHRLDEWPQARPLAADLYPGLLGIGLELWDGASRVGNIEDLDLYVNDDPTGTLEDVEGPINQLLAIVGVMNDRMQNNQTCVWEATIDTVGHVVATRDLLVRHGYGDAVSLAAALEQQPPTIYFLDGTTTIGPVRYDSRTLTSAFDVRLLREIDWDGVDITAETPRTAQRRENSHESIHDRLRDYLVSRPRLGEKRWVIYNDGAGEIADYLVVEELQTGEVSLALWHAKAAHGSVPSIRIKDFQEVVAQALRSRRWFPSTSLWVELGSRLAQLSRPWATLVDGSDDLDLLNRKLGLVEDETVSPWTKRFPNVRGTLGIVQPGLSAGAMRTALGSDPIPAAAQSLQELFSVLSDTALSDGAELVFLVSS